MPARVTWALGYQEHLDCPVDANPPVREYSWKKNTYLVSFSSDHITLLPNGSLLVKSVQHSDAGAYSCMPVSSIGNSQSSPLVQVIVQGKANDMYCLQIQLMDQIHVSVMVHCIGNFLEVYGLESILYVLFSKMTFFPPFLLIVSKNSYILSENRFVCSRNAFIQADIGLLFRTVCAWSIICTVQAAEAKDFYWLKCVTVSWPIITRYIMTCIQDAYNFCLELLIDELHLLNTKAQHVLALL